MSVPTVVLSPAWDGMVAGVVPDPGVAVGVAAGGTVRATVETTAGSALRRSGLALPIPPDTGGWRTNRQRESLRRLFGEDGPAVGAPQRVRPQEAARSAPLVGRGAT